MRSFLSDPETRRNVFFKNLQTQYSVPGIYIFAIAVTMGMIVVMAMLVICAVQVVPGAEHHPHGNADDQDTRGKLEVMFGCRGIPLTAETQSDQCDCPDHGSV